MRGLAGFQIVQRGAQLALDAARIGERADANRGAVGFDGAAVGDEEARRRHEGLSGCVDINYASCVVYVNAYCVDYFDRIEMGGRAWGAARGAVF